MTEEVRVFRVIVSIGLTVIGIILATVFSHYMIVFFAIGGLLAVFAGLWALVEVSILFRARADNKFEKRFQKKFVKDSPSDPATPG